MFSIQAITNFGTITVSAKGSPAEIRDLYVSKFLGGYEINGTSWPCVIAKA